jgi:uncharacterized metal-binding protein
MLVLYLLVAHSKSIVKFFVEASLIFETTEFEHQVVGTQRLQFAEVGVAWCTEREKVKSRMASVFNIGEKSSHGHAFLSVRKHEL